MTAMNVTRMEAPFTPDEAHARAIVALMPALVDRRDWAALGPCFADRLRLDYTSLWGGEPQEVTREDLVAQWRAMLPGFDATWHQLGPVSVKVQGGRATAEAAVTGTHVLGGEAWVVGGLYRIELQRSDVGGDPRGDPAWRIVALALVCDREEGDRALADRAKFQAGAD